MDTNEDQPPSTAEIIDPQTVVRKRKTKLQTIQEKKNKKEAKQQSYETAVNDLMSHKFKSVHAAASFHGVNKK